MLGSVGVPGADALERSSDAMDGQDDAEIEDLALTVVKVVRVSAKLPHDLLPAHCCVSMVCCGYFDSKIEQTLKL